MKKKLYEDFESTGKTNAIKKRVNELIKESKSMVILDTKKEYEELFKNTNYEIIKLDISDINSDIAYNPLYDAEKLFKNGNIDGSIEKIVNFGKLLINTKDSVDPFWDDSARSMFIGICLYILNNNRSLNLKEVIKVSIDEIDEMTKYINNLDVLNYINIITSSVINAPVETKGGIMSVLKQYLGYFAHRPNLLDKISVDRGIELKSKNQVILLTNFSQKTIFNIIIEIALINIINEMIDSKEEYVVVLDNYDSIMNTEEFTKLFKSYLSDNIECIVGVRDNSLVKPLDEFLVMYRKRKLTE